MSGPAITAVIPTFNRPVQLQACLNSLAAQSLDRSRFEVIVVDDGGQPPARPVPNGLRLEVLRQPNRGPAAARNLAAGHARSPILAFTDDDCRPGAAWLQSLLDAAERRPGALLGGATRNGLPDNPYAIASQLIQDIAYRWYNSGPEGAGFFASNNLALPREAFLDLGGFHPGFRTAEDRDLCDRWRAAGHPLHHVPEAEVVHAHPLTLRSFARQHFDYGRGARRYQLAHRARTGRSSIDPRFYWSILVGLPGTLASKRRPLAVAASLAVWQAANTAGFVAEMLRPEVDRAPR